IDGCGIPIETPCACSAPSVRTRRAAGGEAAVCKKATPVCSDYSYWLAQCTRRYSISPNVKAWQLDIGFQGGSGKVKKRLPDAAGWPRVLAELRACPLPPVPPPSNAAPVPVDIATCNGHGLNIVCKDPEPASTCPAGMKECILYEPQAGGLVVT